MTVIGDMIGAQGGGANQANSPSEWRAQEYRERKSSYTQLKGRLGASKDQLLLLPAGWLAGWLLGRIGLPYIHCTLPRHPHNLITSCDTPKYIYNVRSSTIVIIVPLLVGPTDPQQQQQRRRRRR